jgi:transposase
MRPSRPGNTSSLVELAQLRSEIAPLLAVLLSVNHQLEWVDGRLGHLAQSDETVARLCTAPSVGLVTAAAFASTIDEVNRFRNAHQVEAYLGLTPSEMSSGERQHKGRITKAGKGAASQKDGEAMFWQPAVSFLAGRCVADQPAAVPGTGRAVERPTTRRRSK